MQNSYTKMLESIPSWVILNYVQNNIQFIDPGSKMRISKNEKLLQFLFAKTVGFMLEYEGKMQGFSEHVLYENGVVKNFQLITLAEHGGKSIQKERKKILLKYLFDNGITQEIYDYLLGIYQNACSESIQTLMNKEDFFEYADFFVILQKKSLDTITCLSLWNSIFNRKIGFKNQSIPLPKSFLPKIVGRLNADQCKIVADYFDILRGRLLTHVAQEILRNLTKQEVYEYA